MKSNLNLLQTRRHQTSNLLKFTLRNVNEVSKALKDPNQTKATGSDGIAAKVLKMAEPSVYQSLTHLFNASLQAGQFPFNWKKARVTPLFKGGTATDCDNYRFQCYPQFQKSLNPLQIRTYRTLLTSPVS